MPVMKFIQKTYPWVTPYLWVPDYFLPFARNLLPYMVVRPFSKRLKLFNEKWPTRQTMLKGHDSLSTHLVDYNFNALGNKQVQIQDKNYVKLDLSRIFIEKFKLPKEYVVITTGYTAKIREFMPEKVNKITEYLNNKNMPVVFLGNRQTFTGENVSNIVGHFNESIDFSKGINLVDKTSLLEAGKIIAGAKAIVGIDNGLMHIAGCTDTPIVGGFTSVSPHLRNPYRNNELGWNCYNVIPPESCKERFFQSNWDYIFNFDFRFCYYNDYECVKSINAQDFINHLETILK